MQKSAFHRSQTLVYRNGFAVPRRPTVGIGQDPLLSEQLIQQQISELSSETPYITRGSYQEQGLVEDFIPAYVALDKKVQSDPEDQHLKMFCWSWFLFLTKLFFL